MPPQTEKQKDSEKECGDPFKHSWLRNLQHAYSPRDISKKIEKDGLHFYLGIESLMIGHACHALKEFPSNTAYHLTSTAIIGRHGLRDVIPWSAFKNDDEWLAQTGQVKSLLLSLWPMEEMDIDVFENGQEQSSRGNYHDLTFSGVNVSENLYRSMKSEQVLRPRNIFAMMAAVLVVYYGFHRKVEAQPLTLNEYIKQRLPDILPSLIIGEIPEKTEYRELISWALDTLGITGAWGKMILFQTSDDHVLSSEEYGRYSFAQVFSAQDLCYTILRSQNIDRTIGEINRVPIVLEFDAMHACPTIEIQGEKVPYTYYTWSRPPSILSLPKIPKTAVRAIRYFKQDEMELFRTITAMGFSAHTYEGGVFRVFREDISDDSPDSSYDQHYIPVIPIDESVPLIDHCMNRYSDRVTQTQWILSLLESGEATFVNDHVKRLQVVEQHCLLRGIELSAKQRKAVQENLHINGNQ